MLQRSIIAIGGSAGSFQTLIQIAKDLPEDLPAALFIVVHTRAREQSTLAQSLGSRSKLPVVDALDGQHFANGTIYVAPPDRHLVIAGDHVHLSRGPKEGLHRPSINVTFRSAAACCDGRVIGVLLSGLLDDGASGLWDIARNHGISIVQDPEEAQFPSMPMSALEAVPINFILKSNEIASHLVELVNSPEKLHAKKAPAVNGTSRGPFSGLTCPECHGPLYEYRKEPAEFICRVGHIFPLRTLAEESTATQEKRMYEAIVSLEEGADIAEMAAKQARDGPRKQLLTEARQLRKHSQAIHRLIEERGTPSVGE